MASLALFSIDFSNEADSLAHAKLIKSNQNKILSVPIFTVAYENDIISPICHITRVLLLSGCSQFQL
jgi:hypothetical protein